ERWRMTHLHVFRMRQAPRLGRETDQLVLEPMLQSAERGIRPDATAVPHHGLEQRLPSVRRLVVVAQAEHVALLAAAPPDLFRAGRARLRRGELPGGATVVLDELVDGFVVAL